MKIAEAAEGGMGGDRQGALVDLAVWLAALALVAMSGKLLARAAATLGAWAWVAPVVPMALLFLLATGMLYRRGERWRSLGFRAPASFKRVAGLVVAGYLVLIVGNAVVVLVLLPKLAVTQPNFGAFSGLKGHPALFAFWLAFAWVSAAFGEELQFRGFLWSRLERLFGGGRGSAVLTLFTQAALFGLCHLYQGVGGVIATGMAGLMLGGVYWAGNRNLIAVIILHGLIDTVSLTVLFLGLTPAALHH
jgi:membrane protease YdiL (CAAX protease family)